MPGLRMLSGSLRVARARILSPHGSALSYGGQGTADMAFEGWITALAWSLCYCQPPPTPVLCANPLRLIAFNWGFPGGPGSALLQSDLISYHFFFFFIIFF